MMSSFQLDPYEQLATDELSRFAREEIAPSIAQQLGETLPKATAHSIMRRLTGFGLGSGWVGEDGGGLGISFRLSGRLY